MAQELTLVREITAMSDGKVISADSHVQEPGDLYDRLPEKFREQAPRIEEIDGGTYMIVAGKKPRRVDVAKADATEDDQDREFRSDPTGGRDLERRLGDQERDGVCAEVIYPNQSLLLYTAPDPDYQLAVARAYNDWAIEAFGPRPDRFLPVAVLPVKDIPGAVAEVERVAKLGYRSVGVPLVNRTLSYRHPDYEPLWSALEDANIVLSLHAFSNSEDIYPENMGEADSDYGGTLNYMVLGMADGQVPVSELICAGVCDRHPGLKFVVVECGSGWLAWLLHVLDEQAEKKHMWIHPKLELRPSEYFLRQGYVTFSDDPVALQTLSFTGAGCLLWGSDYPHDEGTFPFSQSVIERTFESISDADRHKIVYQNAADLYGLTG
jgi:predicted TIM-barrel fold metal-dependent hydrolase